MVNCVVKKCASQSSKNKKQDGVTFHIFPSRHQHMQQLDKWVDVIRVSRNDPTWLPGSRTVICSMHFHDDDFYTTKKGLRRIKKNAYPKVVYTLQKQNVFHEVNEVYSTRHSAVHTDALGPTNAASIARAAAPVSPISEMPSCVVKCCKNYISKVKKPQGITYHVFPRNKRLKDSWILMIRKARGDSDWNPTPFSTVCSAHFDEQDFMITPKGLRRLYPCVIPKNLLTDPETDTLSRFSPTRQISESSSVEQPSCSSFADSDMEQEHPEEKLDPTTFMEIKQEVLWGGEQSSKEPGAAQAEQGAGEAAPPRGVLGERGERGILEELRREMGTVARRDEVSSGLEEIRQEIRGLAQGDEFDAFGRYVASLLRNMRPRRASHAQPLLINLLAAEMMKQNDDDLA
ncbi:uncharacterized protein LOC121735623 [Aricia agestis]|uniref:uncharacterized protein LOC121735623 n=1 Tax=Aricia agestis TaxID=91739 RepID=UPI001C206B37|nr:uncharacterized protein LOC121735623 [Aricia agestis]